MESTSNRPKFTEILAALKHKRMWINMLLGFSGGLPIMIVFATVKIWMRREGVDLSTIGIMGIVALPYSLNFLMGPLLDNLYPKSFGRRRAWLLGTQVGLLVTMLGISLCDPQSSVMMLAALTLVLCFFSATQDVAIDAYRREILPDHEIAMGTSIYVYGYRAAMFMCSGVGLWMVDPKTMGWSFNNLFVFLAGLMTVGIFATFIAIEPKAETEEKKTLQTMVINPFKEFFSRQGVRVGLIILGFIFLFKFGDNFAFSMVQPFYVDMGYSNADIATATKTVGFISMLAGLAVGAVAIFRFGIIRCLIVFGILQAISTGLFSLLTFEGIKGSWLALAGVVAFEDFSAGLGSTALLTFMATMTNKRYTATQYALFASLAALGKTLFGGFSGYLVEAVGFRLFFWSGAAMAIPGMILIYFIWQIQKDDPEGNAESTPPSTGYEGIETSSNARTTLTPEMAQARSKNSDSGLQL